MELCKVVLGKLTVPNDAQEARAAKNGGWEARKIDGIDVLFNACVSPPFAGASYELKGV